jgi:hypothetical protein
MTPLTRCTRWSRTRTICGQTGVFRAKGREPQRSLPILIRDTLMAEDLASELNGRFFLLARRFWL